MAPPHPAPDPDVRAQEPSSRALDPDVDAVGDPTDPTDPTPPTTGVERRPWRRSVLIGIFVGFAVAGVVYLLIAMPLYFLASLEANGRDRPIVRTGLIVVGPSLAIPLGAIAGILGGRWYRSGREWRAQEAPQ